MQCHLREGASFCIIDGQIILLDLQIDRYFMLSPRANDAFHDLMRGIERDIAPCALHALLSSGILVPDAGGSPLIPCTGKAALTSFLDAGSEATSAFPSLVQALRAFASARIRLRTMGFASCMRRIKAMKAALSPLSDPRQPNALFDTASAFRALDLLITPRDRCLARSFALAARSYQLQQAPDLVLAVKLKPFAAHCWVQSGSMVLNDRVDHVRDFTPVLVV